MENTEPIEDIEKQIKVTTGRGRQILLVLYRVGEPSPSIIKGNEENVDRLNKRII